MTGDGVQDLYVSSHGNTNSVLLFDGSTGSFIETYVPAGLGGLSYPTGLLFDSDGNLLVVNNGSDSVGRYGKDSQAVFTVTLSKPSGVPVTVEFSTADGSAVAGSDYTAVSGTIIFAPGVTTRTILVSTLDDAVEESTESFFVNLTAPTGAVILDNQGEATIVDDDTPASANDIYVWDIAFDSRLRGKGGSKHDERIFVTVRRDSDADGVAEGSDAVVAGANVTVEVRNSTGSLVGTLSGITNTAGLFTSSYLMDLPDGTYTVEVVALSHATYVWNGDLDPTANDGDADGDGLPDETHTIPHSAAASSTRTASSSTSSTDAGTTDSTSTQDVVLQPINSARLLDPALTEEEPDDESSTEEDPAISSEDQADLDSLFGDLDGSLLDELLAV